MKCPNCQQENHEDNLYCTSCGNKLEKKGKECPVCRTVNSDEAVYCVSCGQKLGVEEVSNSKKCSSCGADNPKENLYCVACGAKIYDQQTVNTVVDGNSILDTEKKAQNSLILGIIALSVSAVCCCTPFVGQIAGIVLAIIAIINGVKGLASVDKTKSIIGIVLAGIAILLSGYMLVSYIISFGMLGTMSEEEIKALLEEYGFAEYAVIKTYIKCLFIK